MTLLDYSPTFWREMKKSGEEAWIVNKLNLQIKDKYTRVFYISIVAENVCKTFKTFCILLMELCNRHNSNIATQFKVPRLCFKRVTCMRLVLDRNAGHWSDIDIHSKLDSPIHLPFHHSDSNAVSVSLYVCLIFFFFNRA